MLRQASLLVGVFVIDIFALLFSVLGGLSSCVLYAFCCCCCSDNKKEILHPKEPTFSHSNSQHSSVVPLVKDEINVALSTPKLTGYLTLKLLLLAR